MTTFPGFVDALLAWKNWRGAAYQRPAHLMVYGSHSICPDTMAVDTLHGRYFLSVVSSISYGRPRMVWFQNGGSVFLVIRYH